MDIEKRTTLSRIKTLDVDGSIIHVKAGPREILLILGVVRNMHPPSIKCLVHDAGHFTIDYIRLDAKVFVVKDVLAS